MKLRDKLATEYSFYSTSHCWNQALARAKSDIRARWWRFKIKRTIAKFRRNFNDK